MNGLFDPLDIAGLNLPEGCILRILVFVTTGSMQHTLDSILHPTSDGVPLA